MRIGVVSYGLDRQLTGIGRAAVGLIEALKATGEVDLVPLAPYGRGRFREPPWHSRRLFACGLMPAMMTLGNLEVLRAARAERLDIVHDPTSISPFASRWGWGSCGRVLTIHDTIPLIKSASTDLNDFLYRHWLPLTLSNVDAIITPSAASKADIVEHYGVPPGRVHVTYWGIEKKFRPVVSSEAGPLLQRYGVRPPFLLQVGGLNERKNLELSLRAFDSLHVRHPDLQLVVTGRAASTTTRAAQLSSAREGVVFTGFVSDGDLPSLYSQATVTLFPSLYEGFGFPMLESMACGTPVVASNAPALMEIGGDAASYVDPYDPSSLTEAVLQLLESKAHWAEMRERGLVWAQAFNWAETARRTIEVYASIAQSR